MKNLVSIAILFLSLQGFAQVGFNNPNPDGSSILDLTTTTKGLLIPRMTSTERDGITTPATGLLVYNTTESCFFFYNGTAWQGILKAFKTANGFQISSNVGINMAPSATTALSVTGNISTTGTLTATNYAINTSGNGPIPAGGIIIWSGSIAAIPAGYALCDGANGTPDLRDRFLVGAGNGYSVGVTGGADNHTITIAEMPSHQHVMNHGHTISDPGHSHSLNERIRGNENGTNSYTLANDASARSTNTAYTGISVDWLNANTWLEGGGAAYDNRPKFYALAYIMKL